MNICERMDAAMEELIVRGLEPAAILLGEKEFTEMALEAGPLRRDWLVTYMGVPVRRSRHASGVLVVTEGVWRHLKNVVLHETPSPSWRDFRDAPNVATRNAAPKPLFR